MTDDNRLYARFTIDLMDSPKIDPLSDSAFRGWFKSICWSRRHLTDGFIPESMIKKFFSKKTLKEITNNDASKPSLVQVEGGYQIHDFVEHQMTKASIEAKREAGRKGGRAKAAASSSSSESVAGAREMLKQTASEKLAKTETETETYSSTKNRTALRGSRINRNFVISDEMRNWAKNDVPLVNVDAKLAEWIDYWASVPGQKGVKLDWISTWRNGMRKQQEFAARDQLTAINGGKPSPTERAMRTLRLATDLDLKELTR